MKPNAKTPIKSSQQNQFSSFQPTKKPNQVSFKLLQEKFKKKKLQIKQNLKQKTQPTKNKQEPSLSTSFQNFIADELSSQHCP